MLPTKSNILPVHHDPCARLPLPLSSLKASDQLKQR